MEHIDTVTSLINALIEEKMRLGKKRWDAHAEVMRERPDLRQQLIDAKKQTKR